MSSDQINHVHGKVDMAEDISRTSSRYLSHHILLDPFAGDIGN